MTEHTQTAVEALRQEEHELLIRLDQENAAAKATRKELLGVRTALRAFGLSPTESKKNGSSKSPDKEAIIKAAIAVLNDLHGEPIPYADLRSRIQSRLEEAGFEDFVGKFSHLKTYLCQDGAFIESEPDIYCLESNTPHSS